MPTSRPHPARSLALTSALLLSACQTSKPPMAEVDSLLSTDPPAAGASSCPPLPGDWLSNMPAQLRRVEPADCSQQASTPLFAWGDARDRISTSGYSLVVRQAGGATVLSQSGINEPRARLPRALPAGNYEWAISYSASNGATQTTQWRRFSVGAPDGQMRPQDLPEGAQVAAQVTARARPRVLAGGASFERLRPLAQQAEHLPALNLLRARAAAAQQAAVPANPPSAAAANALAQAQALNLVVQTARNERIALEALSFVARLDANTALLAAAKRRLLGLAAWPAGGSTGEAAASAANAELTQALAYGLDLLWNDLSTTERAQIVAPLRERLMQASSAAFTQLDREPHAAAALLRLRAHTQALLLAAGTFPESQPLLARAWELNRHGLQHWGSDGNQGPAIAQAWQQFAATTQFAAAVRTIAGVDLYEIAALRRSAEPLMAFTAPGVEQAAAFGDEAEIRDLYDRHVAALRLHAQQSRDVPAIWYWQAKPANLSAPADASVWQLLLLGANSLPLPTGSATLANDWYSTQAGLAAMHSDIRSASRSSVYFLSGRHGAYGAAQAEQNALAYVSQGRPLLVNAGSTPYVGSPHHRNTRATRFKNALTFDGGIGQAEANAGATRPGDPLFNMDPSGSLIRAQSAGNYAAVTGDATAAYRAVDPARNTWTPLLSNAVRSVVVDKANGLTLVYDWATSATPRQWELNFHAPNAFVSDAATVRSVNGGASVCLDRHGPATQFTQSAGWEVAPEVPQQAAPARGRFSTLARSGEFAHLTVLREGCRNVPVQVSQTGSQINIVINGRDALQFDRRSLSLPASAAGSPPVVSIAAAAAIAAGTGGTAVGGNAAAPVTGGTATTQMPTTPSGGESSTPASTVNSNETTSLLRRLPLTQEALLQFNADFQLRHEALPNGVPTAYDWYQKPKAGRWNTVPAGFTAMTGWGQAFWVKGSKATTGYLMLKNHQTLVCYGSQRRWGVVQESAVEGAEFRPDFQTNLAKRATYAGPTEPGATTVDYALENAYHFWPSGGRASIPSGPLCGVLVLVQARVAPYSAGSYNPPNMLLGLGGDYWLNKTAEWDNFKTNKDIAIGRLRLVGTTWGWYGLSTASDTDLRNLYRQGYTDLRVSTSK